MDSLGIGSNRVRACVEMDEKLGARWERQWRRLRKTLLGETHSLLTSLSRVRAAGMCPTQLHRVLQIPSIRTSENVVDRVLESVLIAQHF